ncbi:hypothetical protein [Neorhizobium alkalisoli]|uniref:Uncharacterized protein n=1 Tax=Neorhizobium alkalisoli TaxID=528178 RepID=A0A561QXI8_9HYPH|nr:hypothetical protein [Neorhizobium alkalisoli]TWF55088.1 hypothetical protein FHW37_103962 [Neorhizobium alkalisoli]
MRLSVASMLALSLALGAAGCSQADDPPKGPQKFAAEACPFTIDIPGNAKLDSSGIETTDFQPEKQVSAFWNAPDTEFVVMCMGIPNYKLDAGYVDNICSPKNPNLVVGSICGPTQKFGGVEVAMPMTGPDSGVAYYWIYTGHKEGKGRLSFRVATTKSKPDDQEKQRIDTLAQSVFETIR